MSNVNILLARPIEESNLSEPSCLSTRMDWVGGLKSKISLFVGYKEINSTHD